MNRYFIHKDYGVLSKQEGQNEKKKLFKKYLNISENSHLICTFWAIVPSALNIDTTEYLYEFVRAPAACL